MTNLPSDAVSDRFLDRPATWNVIVLLAVGIRVAFVLAPFDVLSPVDAHELGRLLFEGQVPYRDFGLEYPPGSLLAFLLPGLAPASIAPQVLALQAVVVDAAVIALMRSSQRVLRRYVLLSIVLFPLMSGGFDVIAVACIAWSTSLLARGDERGWAVAGLGATVKIFPGVAWAWVRRWGRAGTVALAATAAVLIVPLAMGDGRDVYLRYHLERGVQQESLAASATYLVRRITGDPIEIAYRFRAQEVVGAETAGTVLFVAFGLAAAALAVYCWRRPVQVDPWLASFAVLTVALCGSKVLSPQFMLLAAPAAAYLGGRIFDTYVLIGFLSLLAFTDDSKGNTFMTVVAVRNVLFLALAVSAALQLVRREPALDDALSQRNTNGQRPAQSNKPAPPT